MNRSQRNVHSRLTGVLALATLTLLGAIAMPAAASAEPSKVKVMSRNLYLGADLTPALAAPNPPAVFRAAGDIWDQMQDTNFPARARLLAEEIENSNPDMIGLQEVALWRRGVMDHATGSPTPSEEVVHDFLELLQHQLAKRGLNYRVAVVQREADIELPVDRTDDATTNPTFDARLTMRDVILAKRGMQVRNRQHENYSAFLALPTAVGTVQVIRGYTAVDVRKGRRGERFRFINTHLEAFHPGTRTAQANELVGAGGVTATSLPIVLLGDLNSDPADSSPSSDAYNAVTGAGFADRGVEVDTCCYDADLRNAPPAAFDSRIDHVMSRGTVSERNAFLVGVDPLLRTPTGLWPSDHAGVVSALTVS